MSSRTADRLAAGVVVGRRVVVASLVTFSAIVVLLPTNDEKATATMFVVLPGFLLGTFAYLRAGGRIEPTPLDVPALTYLMFASLATLFSPNPWLSIVPNPIRGDGLPIHVAYVFAALAAARLDPREVRTLVGWILLAAVPISAIALGEYYLVPLALAIGNVGLSVGPRGWGTLANAILLGGYLCLVLPITVAVAVDAAPGWMWRARLAAAGLVYGALVTSLTRAAWLPLAAVAPALAWCLRGGPRTGRMVVLAVVFAAVTVVLAPRAMIPLGTRAESTFNTSDASLAQRLYVWRGVVQLVAERPLFGWGFNNLAGQFPGVGTAEYARTFGSPDVIVDVAHNDILYYAFCTGLPGLAAYLWMWYMALAAVFETLRARRPGAGDEVRFVGGLGCGLVAYFVWAQLAWTHIGPANVFWTLAGVAVALGPRRAAAAVPVIGEAQPAA